MAQPACPRRPGPVPRRLMPRICPQPSRPGVVVPLATSAARSRGTPVRVHPVQPPALRCLEVPAPASSTSVTSTRCSCPRTGGLHRLRVRGVRFSDMGLYSLGTKLHAQCLGWWWKVSRDPGSPRPRPRQAPRLRARGPPPQRSALWTPCPQRTGRPPSTFSTPLQCGPPQQASSTPP